MKLRVTKKFEFEMAHALANYDGKCKNIHGHTYKLFVTVIGEPILNENDPKNGMVMDFGILKDIVKTNIIDVYDHSLLLNKNSNHRNISLNDFNIDKVYYKDYQPTCENILLEFVDILKKALPNSVNLYSVKLFETSSSYAEWNMIDNL